MPLFSVVCLCLYLCWLQVHQETFGKSGCRRIVPGQYLAVDPKGRAVMIGEHVHRVCVCICVCTAVHSHTPYAVLFWYTPSYSIHVHHKVQCTFAMCSDSVGHYTVGFS